MIFFFFFNSLAISKNYYFSTITKSKPINKLNNIKYKTLNLFDSK